VASVDVAPRRGETVLGSDAERQPGGKGANQAIAAERLGARVSMIGAAAVGDPKSQPTLRPLDYYAP